MSTASKPVGSSPVRPLRILRLLLHVRETSAPYNQFSLAMRDRYDITLCPFFEPRIPIPSEIDVCKGDGSVKGFLRALRAALEAREYDVVHAHSPHVAFMYLLAILFYRIASPPTVLTLHTSYPNVKLRNQLMLIPVFVAFRRIVCCSQSSLESFPAFFRWLGGSRLCAVRNGVDVVRVDRSVARYAGERRQDSFTAVSIGRLMELKNPLVILEAFRAASAPESRLRFIGTGPLRESIQAAARAADLAQRVELTDLIPREDVYKALSEADLYISASSCEGLPVAALEAMVCRCPVLLSDIPPHREIADGADFVPLVAPDDAAGFARELTRFRAMSADARREIGQRCRELVVERFALEAMQRGYEEVYAAIRGGTGRTTGESTPSRGQRSPASGGPAEPARDD